MKKKTITIYFQGLKKNGATGGIPRYEASLKRKLNENTEVKFTIIENSLAHKRGFTWLLPLLVFLPFFIKERSSIVLSMNYKIPLFVFPSVPRMIIVHDLFHMTVPKLMPFSRWILSKLMFPFCLRAVDIIIVPSQSTKNDIIKFYPKYESKIRVVPLAGNFMPDEYGETIESSLLELKDYFLFVGTVEPRKNLINLVQAYKCLPDELKKKHPLIIAGRQGWGGIDILSHINELELNKHVIWYDNPTDSEVIFLYKNALCLTFPSFYEGFGLPIIEAHQFGVPVITSNISAMPEISGDAAILVEPHSVESIAQGLKKIAENTSLKNKLSKAAIKNAKKYSWENTTKGIIDIIIETSARKNSKRAPYL